MQSGVPKKKDWLFIIGLILFVFGYLVFLSQTMVAFLGLPFYFIGAIMVCFSRKSWKVKLLLILPTLILNWFTLRWLEGSL